MSKQTDISQLIRKYLNGELDAQAMHQLEKEAQNDPFLMEALEGYEQFGADQQENMADVYARLHDRTHKTERRIIPWKWISIAASILILFIIGGLWLRQQSPVTNKTIVKVSKPKPVSPATKPTEADKIEAIIHLPAITKQIAKNGRYKIYKMSIYAPPNVSEDKAAESVTSPSSANMDISQPVGNSDAKVTEVEPNEFKPDSAYLSRTAKYYKDKTRSTAFNADISNKPLTGIVKDESGAPLPGVSLTIKGSSIVTVTDLNGKFKLPEVPKNAELDLAFVGYNPKQISLNKPDSLVIAMQPNNNSLNEVVVVGYGTQKKKSIKSNKNGIVKGVVTSKDDGQPMPGVMVSVKGTNIATQTNSAGRFVLSGVPNNATLNFGYIGYIAQNIPLRKNDSLSVALQQSNSDLAEVVISQPAAKQNNDAEQPVYEGAHPANGWSTFKKYLNDNAISPDGKTGVVKISFKVDENGSLSDFKIKRSLSTETDDAAIQLIQDGSRWISNTNHTSETVTVRVRFKPKK